MAEAVIPHPTVDERRAKGRTARERSPLASHTGWMPAGDRPDPVALLEAQNLTREPDLVPVRHGRTDDVINVAGHRLGTREIEEALSSHTAVAEVAVVGVADPLKGQVALAFVVLRDADRYAADEARAKLEADLITTVDRQLGAIARPARVHMVSMLPKTRSGKLLRRAIAALAEGREPGDLPTIEDPAALQQVREALG